MTNEFFNILLGLRPEIGPDRGPDGGRDLIVVEERPGLLGSTSFRWLVSCKHNAHSGSAVPSSEEPDVAGRLTRFRAQGFLGFYSTLPASSLTLALEQYRQTSQSEISILDRALIEHELMENLRLRMVFQRYFPESFARFSQQDRSPALVTDAYEPLECAYCGKDLLAAGPYAGIVVEAWKPGDQSGRLIDRVYVCCKGRCDRILERECAGLSLTTSWEDIEDLKIPLVYLKYVIATLNRGRAGLESYSDDGFDQLKGFLIRMAQPVVREATPEQLDRLSALAELPRPI